MSPTTTDNAPVAVEVHLGAGWRERELRDDVRHGLGRDPKSLPPKWFYDEVGSDLFEQITRLPEYYPTRAEREILQRQAPAIAELTKATTFIELGSGTSDKTTAVLDALTAAGHLDTFVPFDVSEATLRQAAHDIASQYPGLAVHAVVGDFEHHLDRIPARGRRLMAMFGGTIGNFVPSARARFLADVADQLDSGDFFLVGTDLVKNRDRLVAAYDDAAGMTAAFNKNALAVINRELGADFDLDAFEHVAIFDDDHEWIEMRLRSLRPQQVRITALDLTVDFAAGEDLCTEVSAKFRPEGVVAELDAAGFDLVEFWTDSSDDYAVSLARRR